MSCWRRTTVLRIPAASLGFRFKWQWDAFLEKNDPIFDWEPGCFAQALCESFREWFPGQYDYADDPNRELAAPDPIHPESAAGPFLDYYLKETELLKPKEIHYHENDYVRTLSQEEKKQYLPLYQELFPDFTLSKMEKVHYCEYEWYDGTEAPYYY